jgi:methyl-accepting chemotaxis protein
MNSWTISRRIIFGFAAMLLIAVVLGAVALWRLAGVSQSVAQLADNTLPSILTLREYAGATRDNIFTILLYADAEPGDQRKALEDRISANRTRIDELIKIYEPLISDREDGRLFEEAKRTRAAFITIRTRYLDLVRQGKAEEHKKLLSEAVIPAYEDTVGAATPVSSITKTGHGLAKLGKRTPNPASCSSASHSVPLSWPAS